MAVVLAVVAFVAIAPAARAAFPGRNGVIAYPALGAGIEGGLSEMWTVDPGTGATTQLTSLSLVSGPAWSDDGRTLAFRSFVGRRGDVISAVPGRRPAAAPWTFGDVEYMTLPGQPIPPDPAGHAFDFDPAWAPGNRRIVYRTAAGDLVVLSGDDTKRVIAIGATADGPAWSPDGRLIAFTRCAVDGRCSLWTIRPTGTNLRRLTNGSMNERAPSWSPDGRRLIFDADTGIWTVNRRGSGRRPRLQRILASGKGPSWSPDGIQIAFGSDDGVYVANADGTDARRVTATPAAVGQTDWQPKVWPMRSSL